LSLKLTCVAKLVLPDLKKSVDKNPPNLSAFEAIEP
jgi:hypothetical protein